MAEVFHADSRSGRARFGSGMPLEASAIERRDGGAVVKSARLTLFAVDAEPPRVPPADFAVSRRAHRRRAFPLRHLAASLSPRESGSPPPRVGWRGCGGGDCTVPLALFGLCGLARFFAYSVSVPPRIIPRPGLVWPTRRGLRRRNRMREQSAAAGRVKSTGRFCISGGGCALRLKWCGLTSGEHYIRDRGHERIKLIATLIFRVHHVAPRSEAPCHCGKAHVRRLGVFPRRHTALKGPRWPGGQASW